jgi:hypothetical protein
MQQWHPLFAQLLRPLLESHYEVQTNVAVGDAPRLADILLLRRTSSGTPPFQGLWRWLSTWNVLEFKGPTVSARVNDLDDLIEIGLGIHRRLNEEGAKQRRSEVGRGEVALWYLANHLGRRFLQAARTLLGDLVPVTDGVWRATVVQRSCFLVSNQALAVERDSLPVHLLTLESEDKQRAVAQVLRGSPDLGPLYRSWLASAHPALLKELPAMGRKKAQEPFFKVAPLIRHLGWQEVIRQTGLKEFIEEVGLDTLVAQLTQQQRRELLRLLQAEGPGDQGESC